MASTFCTWCRTKSHLSRSGPPVASVPVGALPNVDERDLMAPFVCDNCGHMLLAHYRGEESHEQIAAALLENADSGIVWLPLGGLPVHYPDVPDQIASAASEAHSCANIDAHRAAALLARTVVEATAKEVGIVDGNLVRKIDTMRDRDLIREDIRLAAHEIRYLGNEMAHGDFVKSPPVEDSDEILGFMDELLREVFQSPAQIERRRQARLSRQAQRGSAAGAGT